MEAKKQVVLTDFVCMVCKKEINKTRFRRGSGTCSEACAQIVTKIRKLMRDQERCKMCNRPCTDEEVKDWRAWRRDRGKLRAGRGRPTINKPEVMDEQGAGKQ